MKILYDHQMFSLQKYGGISKYFCELMKNLPDEHQFKLSVLISENQHLKDDFGFFKKIYFPVPKNAGRIRSVLRRSAYSLNHYYSTKFLVQNKYDLLHPTYFDPYFLEYIKKPYIVTVHDLIAFKEQKVHQKKRQMARMTQVINNSQRIISVSEHTKQDLVNILNVSPEKIDVVHHGFNPFNLKNNTNHYGRYILYVGARLNYKNFKILSKAFRELSIKDNDLKLICVGSPFSKEELEELERLKIRGKTVAIGVNENKLNQLYANALTFVYPSQYEGFGMPILEAFANNCPVCLSNSSSLPEIAGNAGNYFDPCDLDSVLYSIKKVIYEPEFSGRMIEAGNKRLSNFSWQKCADETLNSYKKAVL